MSNTVYTVKHLFINFMLKLPLKVKPTYTVMLSSINEVNWSNIKWWQVKWPFLSLLGHVTGVMPDSPPP